jgi:hypothetical protein
MKKHYRIFDQGNNTPTPPLFVAIAATGPKQSQNLGTFTTMEKATEALNSQLDEWHESIAFERDNFHHVLDVNFYQFSMILKR